MAYKETQVDDRKWIVYTSDDDHNLEMDSNNIVSTTSRFYETVADMQVDTTLSSGMICHTNGFHTSGDGGAAFYEITASGTANGMDVLALQNSLIANLINGNVANVLTYGAKNDGSVDVTNILQHVIDENQLNTVYFPDGNYLISSTLTTYGDNARFVNFEFSPQARLFTNTVINCLVFIGGKNPNNNDYSSAYLGYKKFFKGGKLDGTNTDWCVKVADGVKDFQMYDTIMFNCESGLMLGNGVTNVGSMDFHIENVTIKGTSAANSTGIVFNRPDGCIMSVRVYGFQTACDIVKSGIYLIDVHTLVLSDNPTFGYENSIAFKIQESATLIGCYSDSESVFIKYVNRYAQLVVDSCNYSCWIDNAQTTMLLLDISTTLANISISNCSFKFRELENDPDTNEPRFHYGIRNSAFSITGQLGGNAINLVNNKFWGGEYVRKGDAIFENSEMSWWAGVTQITFDRWYYLGSFPFSQTMPVRLSIMAGGSLIEKSCLLRPTSSVLNGAGKQDYYPTSSNFSATLGFVINTHSDYNVMDFYIKFTGSGDFLAAPLNARILNRGKYESLIINTIQKAKDANAANQIMASDFSPTYTLNV